MECLELNPSLHCRPYESTALNQQNSNYSLEQTSLWLVVLWSFLGFGCYIILKAVEDTEHAFQISLFHGCNVTVGATGVIWPSSSRGAGLCCENGEEPRLLYTCVLHTEKKTDSFQRQVSHVASHIQHDYHLTKLFICIRGAVRSQHLCVKMVSSAG